MFANLIAQATEKVRKKGVTMPMEWRTIEDDIEIIEGVHLDLSASSPGMRGSSSSSSRSPGRRSRTRTYPSARPPIRSRASSPSPAMLVHYRSSHSHSTPPSFKTHLLAAPRHA
ncbi:hypothetical protein DFP72DRAFT_634932 [Ephemerocybe angulata]|uniref:Uncharacterized protein n=1 Tax=Ephemerocybe angulata TaxID=980116 RepID=A0A8H6HG85_9AGAR|nr:hypothetical protein DFP72DRAFT_634932 [Tulosesus angulatus]